MRIQLYRRFLAVLLVMVLLVPSASPVRAQEVAEPPAETVPAEESSA